MRHSHLLGTLACVFAFSSVASGQGNTIQYVVSGLGSGLNDGTSWDDAFWTLDKALDPLQNGAILTAQNVELHLKQGTYVPNGTLFFAASATPTARETTFLVPVGVVSIIGKYAGTEDFDEPPIGSATILSGDRGTTGDPSDNCYHVLVFDPNIIEDMNLATVIVQDGNADFIPASPLIPNPITSAWIRAPRAFACSSSSRTTQPAPLLSTKPSRSMS